MITYHEIYLHHDSIDYLVEKRLELVRYSYSNGINKCSQFYHCSRNTFKRWSRRYAVYGKSGLYDNSKIPNNMPRKLDQETIDKITSFVLDCKEKKKYITSKNVMRTLGINNCTYETVNRYVNLALRGKKNVAKSKGNNGSIEFKNYLKPFQIIQIDIKYLTDIDSLKPYFSNSKNNYSGLKVKYQITARDVCTGFPIVAYCDEKTLTYTTIFLEKVLHPFLSKIPYLDLSTIKIQTDNGKEFTNKDVKTYRSSGPNDSTFTIFINDHYKKHKLIIPGHCKAQSEVESFHWSIERDCLAWEDIFDNCSLIEQVTNYWEWYINKKRYNCDYTPLEKIKSFYSLKNVSLPYPVIL